MKRPVDNPIAQLLPTSSLVGATKQRPEPPREVADFLCRIANMQLDNATIDFYKQKFGKFLPDFPMDSEIAKLMLKDSPPPPNPPVVVHSRTGKTSIGGTLFSRETIEAINQRRLVVSLSTAIKQAWTAPDAMTRDWKMFILRRQVLSFYYREDQWPASPPPFTPLEQALRYLQIEGEMAKHCENPDCPAPYFFAKKRSQKFCTTTCATPSRLASRRKWWHKKHGKGSKLK